MVVPIVLLSYQFYCSTGSPSSSIGYPRNTDIRQGSRCRTVNGNLRDGHPPVIASADVDHFPGIVGPTQADEEDSGPGVC